LDATQLERKIRLLSLADLGFQNIGQDLPYAHVAAVLQVPPSEVERWVIDGSFSFPFIPTRLESHEFC
jgi:translation initiation factor 3 subunit M